MRSSQTPSVAVLMATYNGAKFIDEQILSLKDNQTPFTLHWLDDHSTDNTRELLRKAAAKHGVELREWHQTEHLGYPAVFFQLLESVEADIYLFSDQDDVWQTGKIDATVADLSRDLSAPVLCFSDALMFKPDDLKNARRVSEVIADARAPKVLQASRLFMALPAVGNTLGLTRALRDLYVQHKDIARAYAIGHTVWIYIIAVAAGFARLLRDVPTTLYRQHGNNFTAFLTSATGFRLRRQWRLQQFLRPAIARQARGFLLAAERLPQSAQRDRAIEIARLVSKTDERQSFSEIMSLLRQRALWPSTRSALFFAAACLMSKANPQMQLKRPATATSR